MHAEARAAFDCRDLSRYRDLFAPGLTYRQADGRVIGRDDWMRDAGAQFHRLSRIRSSFARERIEAEGDGAIEILTQTASVSTTAFVLVHRTWELTRRGRYTWRKHGGRWMIEAVQAIEEQVSPRLLVRPPAPGRRLISRCSGLRTAAETQRLDYETLLTPRPMRPTMRMPRVRFTVRRMMVVVAIAGCSGCRGRGPTAVRLRSPMPCPSGRVRRASILGEGLADGRR